MNKSICVLCGVLLLSAGCTGEQKASPQTASAPQEASPGEALYIRNCKVCHAQALNGAPVPGNRAMWEPRARQGKEVLVEHAVNGFGLMPAKGGKAELTEQEISTVVEYMLAAIQ